MSDVKNNPLYRIITLIQKVDKNQPSFEGDKLVYVTELERAQLQEREEILSLEEILEEQALFFKDPQVLEAAKASILEIKMAGQCLKGAIAQLAKEQIERSAFSAELKAYAISKLGHIYYMPWATVAWTVVYNIHSQVGLDLLVMLTMAHERRHSEQPAEMFQKSTAAAALAAGDSLAYSESPEEWDANQAALSVLEAYVKEHNLLP